MGNTLVGIIQNKFHLKTGNSGELLQGQESGDWYVDADAEIKYLSWIN